MPSKARKQFREKLIPDVMALIEAHRKLNPTGHGRRKLGHVTRSGVLMLCASWETYIEDVLTEGVDFISQTLETPSNLPNRVKGKLSQTVKNSKHNFAVLELSGAGWKRVYHDACCHDCGALNTPKVHQVSELFLNWLGVEQNELKAAWRHDPSDLNDFVRLRGDIAHRGAGAPYVRITDLTKLKEMIDDFSVDTDRFLSDHIREIAGKRPWNRS